jgi:Flp pilus assembly protein TadB
MGIISGMLGAVPTFFWATSALALVLFPIVSFVALWVYSLIFVFAALWFAHYLLEALKELRRKEFNQSLSTDEPVIDMELPKYG